MNWQNRQDLIRTAAMALLAVMLVLAVATLAHAASALTQPALASASAHVRVPEVSALTRHYVEQAAAEVWGVRAPVARLAAQIHQESAWHPGAASDVGAQGLAQFMPSTARWIAREFPDRLGRFDPWDPRQAALAAAIYDQWLLSRADGATACADWALALSAYNGGERALRDEQRNAAQAGRDPDLWFGNTARYRARSASNWVQNRRYVRRILTVLEPAYIRAGWAGQAVCA